MAPPPLVIDLTQDSSRIPKNPYEECQRSGRTIDNQLSVKKPHHKSPERSVASAESSNAAPQSIGNRTSVHPMQPPHPVVPTMTTEDANPEAKPDSRQDDIPRDAVGKTTMSPPPLVIDLTQVPAPVLKNPYEERKRPRRTIDDHFAVKKPFHYSPERSVASSQSSSNAAPRSTGNRASVHPMQPPQPVVATGTTDDDDKPEAKPDKKDDIPRDAFGKFFYTLLNRSVDEYKNPDLWKTLCQELLATEKDPVVEVPTTHLPAQSENIQQHARQRACLVLEEIRETLAQGLESQDKSILLNLKVCTPNHKWILNSEDRFTKVEMSHLQMGTVFRTNEDRLVVALPISRERILSNHPEVEVMGFGEAPSTGSLTITPVAPLLGLFRQFQAVTEDLCNVPFLHMLLGSLEPSEEKFERPVDVTDVSWRVSADMLLEKATQNPQPLFRVPKLTKTQEQAMTTFLEAPPRTIHIVQGPPGTGKTSLLVATIANYLMQNRPVEGGAWMHCRRLLVCAPTNKAISVLASRVLKAATNPAGCTFNALLIGDGGKLMEQEDVNLRRIFLYTWRETLAREYQLIAGYYESPVSREQTGMTHADVVALATNLQKRLLRSLPGLPPNMVVLADQIRWDTTKETQINSGISRKVTRFLKTLASLAGDTVRTELLKSANVIFCTLTSAGSPMVLGSPSVDDLIVDEAAAATEPELYIPFRLRPSRLLVVGDPNQLPATILSKRAVRLGLSESLHERLMFRCKHKYTMLDVQFRMHPEISAFPAKHFYDGKIQDGPNNATRPFLSSYQVGGRYCFLQSNVDEEKAYSGSVKNTFEAGMVARVVEQSIDRHDPLSMDSDRIRVITFYRAQVTAIKKEMTKLGLSDILVSTVDSAQGCESDIVVLSFVRSNGRRAAGFLNDRRRVNVALTRARHQLICVGNADFLAKVANIDCDHVRNLAADAKQRDRVVRGPLASSPQLVTREPPASMVSVDEWP